MGSGFGFPLNFQGKTEEEVPFLKVSDMNLAGNEKHITVWNHTVSRQDVQDLRAKTFPPGTVIFPKIGAAIATNKKRILVRESTFDNNVMGIVPDERRILSHYLFALLQKIDLSSWASASQPPSMRKSVVEAQQIPVPSIDVQELIVAEIDGYQKVINGARAVLENYRTHIPIRPEWPVVELSEVIQGKPKNGYSGKPVDYPTELKVLSLSATTSGTMDISQSKFLDEDIPPDSQCRCQRGDIYLQRGNTKDLVGTAAIFDVDSANYIYPDLMIRVKADESKILSHYLLHALQSGPVRDYLKRNANGAAGSMPKINQGIVEKIPIPLPPLGVQQAIVTEIEGEKALVAANRELIDRFERKIQAAIARVWGDEGPALT